MEAKEGEGSGTPPDDTWQFYGKLNAVKIKLIDSQQPWNYAEMDMTGKALNDEKKLLIGVLNSDTVSLKIEGFPTNRFSPII